jgi:hypothetical protein
MSFEGDIVNFPISEVIQIITLGKKTGSLSIEGKTEEVCIYFNNGFAAYAHAMTGELSLGHLLVKKGIIKQEQLEAAFFKQRELADKGDKLHIGTILLGMGLVPEDDIKFFIELEIQDCIYRAISEDAGNFHFDSENNLERNDIIVAVNVEDMILKGIDRIDQWIKMKKAIGSNESVFIVTANPDKGLDLSIEEWKVLSLIDGNRTFNEILALARLDRFRVSEIIHDMLERDAIARR